MAWYLTRVSMFFDILGDREGDPLSPSDSSPWEGERKVLVYSLWSDMARLSGGRLVCISEFPLPSGEGDRGRGLIRLLLLKLGGVVLWWSRDPLRSFGPAPPERGSKREKRPGVVAKGYVLAP